MSRRSGGSAGRGLMNLVVAGVIFPPLGAVLVSLALVVGLWKLVARTKPTSIYGKLGRLALLALPVWYLVGSPVWRAQEETLNTVALTVIIVGLTALFIDWLLRPATTSEQPGSGRDSRHVPRDVLGEVFRRDEGRCVQCGAVERLEVDHVIPWSRGGATSVDNLQLLCLPCNRSKAATV